MGYSYLFRQVFSGYFHPPPARANAAKTYLLPVPSTKRTAARTTPTRYRKHRRRHPNNTAIPYVHEYEAPTLVEVPSEEVKLTRHQGLQAFLRTS